MHLRDLLPPVVSQFAGRIAGALVAKSAGADFARPSDLGGGSPMAKLSRPYAQSVWVQRAIKHVAGPISAVPLDFSIDGADSDTGYDDPKLAAYWQQPAIRLSFEDFIRASVGWRKLAGECFWIMGDDALVPFPEVRDLARAPKLIVARPDRMRHVVDKGERLGWVFTDGAGHKHNLAAEQVIHLKEWNPYDEWRGLSEYESACIAAETDYLSGTFSRNLMANNGDRGEYIVAKNGVVTDPQREQIVADLRAKRVAAKRGDFRPVFLTGDITVEEPSIQAIDAGVLAMRMHDRHQIFIAFGVPPSMAEVTAAYSVGSASDRYRLIEETCMPEGKALASGIATIASRLTGKQLIAGFDWDEHSVMQAVRRERIASALTLWGMGVPLEKANDYLRLGMEPVPGWEVGYLPFSVSPVGSLPLEDDPALGETIGEEPAPTTDDMLKALSERRARKVVPSCRTVSPVETAGDRWVKARDPKEAAAWRNQQAKRRESEKRTLAAINRQLISARAETLQKIASLYQPAEKSATVTRAAAADLIFSKQTFTAELFAKLRKTAAQTLQAGGQNFFGEIKKDDPFSMPPHEVVQFIRERENALVDTPDEIWESVRSVIQQAIDDGAPHKQLADQVRAAFNGISRGRAQRIAQTETSTAYNTGRQKAMTAAGIEWKQWLTSNNANVRDAHAEANGQIVPVDQPFVVGGESLMYPSDPNGSPGNIINCHCFSISVANGPTEE